MPLISPNHTRLQYSAQILEIQSSWAFGKRNFIGTARNELHGGPGSIGEASTEITIGRGDNDIRTAIRAPQ